LTLTAPLLHLHKKEIIQLGQELGVPWELTWSCYRGEELACGVCDSCILRREGFRQAGIPDPLPYAVNLIDDVNLFIIVWDHLVGISIYLS
jgi:7-cyano-7-deazaguanine synthase